MKLSRSPLLLPLLLSTSLVLGCGSDDTPAAPATAGSGGGGQGGTSGPSGAGGTAAGSGGAPAGSGGAPAGSGGAPAGSGGAAPAGASGETGQGGGSGASGSSGQGGATCATVAGAYVSEGTCNTSSFVFPKSMCVRQLPECNLEISLQGGTVVKGKGEGDSATLTTDNPVPQTCTAKVEGEGQIAVGCVADGFGIECNGTATAVAIADASETCCQTMTQDCTQPDHRCQFVSPDGKSGFTACLPVTGDVAEGEECARVDGQNKQGYDNCAKGLFCSRLGFSSTAPRVCRRYCDASLSCPTGQVCLDQRSAPTVGICYPLCDPFETGKCPQGTICAGANSTAEQGIVTICSPEGTKKEGEDCGGDVYCGVGLYCLAADDRCHAFCDDNHPCTGGQECSLFSNDPALIPGLPALPYGVCK